MEEILAELGPMVFIAEVALFGHAALSSFIAFVASGIATALTFVVVFLCGSPFRQKSQVRELASLPDTRVLVPGIYE